MASKQIIAQHAELRAATTRLWAAMRDRLVCVCDWVDTHPVTDDLLAELPDPDRAVTGGEGTPLVDPRRARPGTVDAARTDASVGRMDRGDAGT